MPRKPLVIRGARQVGKTTLVNQFAAQFEQYIYLNLELSEDKEPFENFTSIENLINKLFFLKNKSLLLLYILNLKLESIFSFEQILYSNLSSCVYNNTFPIGLFISDFLQYVFFIVLLYLFFVSNKKYFRINTKNINRKINIIKFKFPNITINIKININIFNLVYI